MPRSGRRQVQGSVQLSPPRRETIRQGHPPVRVLHRFERPRFLARTGRSLRQMLDLYSRGLRSHGIGHVACGLTYFDGAEEEPPLRLLVEAQWHRVKTDLTAAARELLASG